MSGYVFRQLFHKLAFDKQLPLLNNTHEIPFMPVPDLQHKSFCTAG